MGHEDTSTHRGQVASLWPGGAQKTPSTAGLEGASETSAGTGTDPDPSSGEQVRPRLPPLGGTVTALAIGGGRRARGTADGRQWAVPPWPPPFHDTPGDSGRRGYGEAWPCQRSVTPCVARDAAAWAPPSDPTASSPPGSPPRVLAAWLASPRPRRPARLPASSPPGSPPLALGQWWHQPGQLSHCEPWLGDT